MHIVRKRKEPPLFNRRSTRRAKWPAANWMNAFAVQEAHDLEVMRIETEALVAVFGERRTVNG